MIALLCHLVGDYFLQSDWMALNKTKRTLPCVLHVLLYTVPFAGMMAAGLLPWKPWALAVICGTHFLIDRTYPARYLCYVKNFMAPKSWWYPWKDAQATGYLIGDALKLGDPRAKPAFIAVWLMIIVDNTLHVAINYAALRWL